MDASQAAYDQAHERFLASGYQYETARCLAASAELRWRRDTHGDIDAAQPM